MERVGDNMTINKAWEIVNEEKNSDALVYAYERWQDEKEYEDIKDYLLFVQGFVPCAYKMTKRPFGFKAKCEDGELRVWVAVGSKSYTIKGESVRC